MKFLSFTFSCSFFTSSDRSGRRQEGKKPSLLGFTKLEGMVSRVVPLFTPEESLSKFKVASGFRVELVAAEPLVKDPVFVNWDDQGE